MKEYPCKICILKPICKKDCNKIKNPKDLFKYFIQNKLCPDCETKLILIKIRNLQSLKPNKKYFKDFYCKGCKICFIDKTNNYSRCSFNDLNTWCYEKDLLNQLNRKDCNEELSL